MSVVAIDPRVDLRLLRYFRVVAEELHFGRAAARLGIAQPPLSQQIKRLESLTGVQLFERTSRSVKLTDAGAVLLEAARRATSELGKGLADAQAIASGQRGSLTIGYVALAMTSFLPSLLRRFLSDRPEIRLTLHGEATALQLAALESGAMDAGFVTDLAESGRFVAHARWNESLMVVEPKHSPGASGTRQLVLFPPHQAQTLHDKIIGIARDLGRETTVVQQAESWYSICSLVASGLGFTIAPEGVRRYRIPGLTYTPLSKRVPNVSILLATRRGVLAPALQTFVDHVRASAEA